MSEIKFAFKIAIGAYLGWQVAHGFDAAIGKRIAPKIKLLTDKLNESMQEKELREE